jgi:hypothetical protein
MTSKWNVPNRAMLERGGWQIMHEGDDKWIAVHATSGQMLSTWLNTDKWAEDRREDYNLCAEAAAMDFCYFLAKRVYIEKIMSEIDEEESVK